jgi:ATPase components of various ABC-type transport systems, contain duplicated ATPase
VTSPEPAIVIKNLSFRYPKTLSGRQVTALKKVSLSIGYGECVLVTGESGSGKSTLARCLNGLIPHETKGTMDGDVLVCGMNTKDYEVPDFARHLGMVFQDPGSQLVAGDVESEIAFGLETGGLTDPEIRARIDETAGLLRIGHLVGRSTRDLSWGERQRVAIASVMALRPAVLVFDEPFSGVDAAAVKNLAGILADLKSVRGTTIVIFEHRIAGILPVMDRWIRMEAGTVVADENCHAPGIPGDAGDRENDAANRLSIPGQGFSPVPALSFKEVSFRYPGEPRPALDCITLDLFPGETTVLSGPNGAGKTTLLKHCNGLLRPERGRVFIGAEPLDKKTVAAAAHTVGLLNQHADYQIFESTIAEELAFGPGNTGKTPAEAQKLAETARQGCGLGHIDPSTPPLSLSGGEKQRVALAGILAMDTPVVILDEPTFGLDRALKERIVAVIRGLRDAGKTVIIATHDEEFGNACGDRFLRIDRGRIITDCRRAQSGDPKDTPEKPCGNRHGA